MPTPTFTTSKSDTIKTHVHEISTRTPDYFDWLTIILPVIIPVLTFLLGYRLNDWTEQRKEQKRLKDVKEYFLTLAEFLADILDIQSESIKKAIAKVEIMAEDDITAMTYAELNTNRIESISYSDQYKILVADKVNINEDLIKLNNVSASLDFVDVMKTKIQKVNNDIITQRNKYNESYTKNAAAISEINTKYSLEEKAPITPGEIEFDKINEIYYQYTMEYGTKVLNGTLSTTDVTNRYEQYIKPLYENTRTIRLIIF